MKKTKKQIEDQKRLDYFTGLIMQGLITNNINEYVGSNKIDEYCHLSKRIAIKLINKLDNE